MVKVVFFYANNRMVASTYLGWIQSAFDKLTGLFNQVGLRKNVRKTVGVVCRLCRSSRVRSDKAYTRQMTGKGLSFEEWQQEWLLCL